MSYTKEAIIRIVKEEDIEFIRMQFVDIFGQLKNVAITASQIEKAVNNQITFDGSSIEGYTRINESDQYLYPDLNSFAIFPWRPAQGKVARLNDVTEDGNWYQITFSGTTGYVRADGCQTVQYSDYAGTSAVKSAREDLVDYAKSFLGTRYVWGGASPSGFDCSGFTMYVYAHFGYRMSHGASDQLYAFTRVSTAERLAGDLVFFSYGGGDISHVGIYLGGGAFIHATSNGGVKISYFDGYYSSTYVGAVRILAD